MVPIHDPEGAFYSEATRIKEDSQDNEKFWYVHGSLLRPLDD